MNKRILAGASLATVFAYAQAQSAGDLAFTAFNANDLSQRHLEWRVSWR